jgi:L-2-hydroxyglutarate oxidase LhgO
VHNEIDFLVIGGGILGLSIGREIKLREPNSRVVLIEKEDKLGAHASGRNSGVLHAGFYYSPDSLKAKFCTEGNLELRKLIQRHSLPINECGKVVVAQSELDLVRLRALHDRGIDNGAKISLLPASDLANYEPLARTHTEFLWSPTTAVSDPQKVLQALASESRELGVEIWMRGKVNLLDDQTVKLSDEIFKPRYIINSAGTGAIELAHSVGVGTNYSQLPILGLYKVTEKRNLPLRTLVYPVPNPKNPFLGVHFTVTTNGSIKIGPTAIPILGREQYSLNDFPNISDLNESLSALYSLGTTSPASILRLAMAELPKISLSKLIRDGRKLVPSATTAINWSKQRPGIRAQLVNKDSGSFEMDFVIKNQGRVTHVLNAVSPGWTSAIPFASHILDLALQSAE